MILLFNFTQATYIYIYLHACLQPIHIFTITVFAFCELTTGTKKYCFNHVLTGRVGTVDVERVFPNDLFN